MSVPPSGWTSLEYLRGGVGDDINFAGRPRCRSNCNCSGVVKCRKRAGYVCWMYPFVEKVQFRFPREFYDRSMFIRRVISILKFMRRIDGSITEIVPIVMLLVLLYSFENLFIFLIKVTIKDNIDQFL